jgi:CheY-like chemotaxis protein
MQPIRIALIGGSQELADKLERILAGCRPNEVVGRAPLRADMYHRVSTLLPDLVLIDGSTPGGDEFEATQRVKIRHDPPMVVVLSSQESPDYEESLLAMGADACVPWPEVHERLPRLISELFPDMESDGGGGRWQPRRRVAVVDDDEETAQVVAMHLRSAGFEARAFGDPVLALEAVKTGAFRPDVLIADFFMPRMNGLELIGLTRSLLPNVRCISASGNVREEHIAQFRVRPDCLIPKPYRIQDLVAAAEDLARASAVAEPKG